MNCPLGSGFGRDRRYRILHILTKHRRCWEICLAVISTDIPSLQGLFDLLQHSLLSPLHKLASLLNASLHVLTKHAHLSTWFYNSTAFWFQKKRLFATSISCSRPHSPPPLYIKATLEAVYNLQCPSVLRVNLVIHLQTHIHRSPQFCLSALASPVSSPPLQMSIQNML